MTTLEQWLEHGNAETIEDAAINAGLLASARVIFGNTQLTEYELLAYLRHCAAIHREQGTDPAKLAKRLVKIEQEARQPMTAVQWEEFQRKNKEQ